MDPLLVPRWQKYVRLSSVGRRILIIHVKHLKVRKISFTGSLAVGKLVQEMGAKSNLKAVTLELYVLSFTYAFFPFH